MLGNFVSKQFMLFLLTGGSAAAVNFFSRIFYNQWMSFSAAIVLAYLTGMITAFFLAKFFVFTSSTQRFHYAAVIFTLVNLLAVLQTWGISMFLAYYLLPTVGWKQYTHEISHAIGIIFPVFTSYLGHKRWSFRTS